MKTFRENIRRSPGPGGGGAMKAMSNRRKPQNAGKTLRRVFSYMKPYRFKLFLVLIFIVFSSLANIVGASFISTLIDKYVTPLIGAPNPDFGPLIGALALMAGFYLIGALSSYLYNRIMINITNDTLKLIRDSLFEHMQKLPIKYYDTHTHGELMSRYTNDIDAMRQMISQVIPQLISSVITIVGVVVAMIIQSPLLMVLVLIMLIIMLLVVTIIGKRSGKYFAGMQSSLGKVNGCVEELVGGQKVVKVFCHEKEANEQFNKLNEELTQAGTIAHSYSNILMPIMGNLSYLHYALTAVVGGLMLAYNVTNLTVGKLGSFLQLTRQFSLPITNLSQLFMSIMTALAGAERVFDMMDEKVETDDGKVTLIRAVRNADGSLSETNEKSHLWAWKVPDENGYKLVELKGDVRLEHVVFGYEENKIILNDLSLYAKPGQKIAFVGSTGAGKTTITNLINRFYDINSGKITYDGIDIKDIKKDDLRHSLAMVLQDTHLFTATVMENIRYGNSDATDEECINAAKIANANHFIELLPDGYNTVLTGDGANLSQGQKQLLAIARAAVADPPVLILDEATSSIDTRTESHIEKGMDQLMQGRTVFVIAHRLSTVRNSNAIMVLEHGKIIERGDHQELLELKGKYYQLYMGMFELS